MLANYLIGLREGLEAGLIVGILVAYAIKSDRRDVLPKIWLGVGIAVTVMVALGAILTFGPVGLPESGEQLLTGILSLVAVGLVTWMIFWMGSHASSLAGELRGKLDSAFTGGAWAIVVLALIGVMREGIETALFVWAASLNSGPTTMAGALFGIATAVLLAWLITLGLIRINLRTFFAWTGGLLILFAAGVLASASREFIEVGLLPETAPVYELSGALATTEPLGAVLAGVLNFSANPTLIEVLVWWAYLLVVGGLFARQVRHARPQSAPARPEAQRVA